MSPYREPPTPEDREKTRVLFAAVVGVAMFTSVFWTFVHDMFVHEPAAAAAPAHDFAALTSACDNVCNVLGMRHVSHDPHSPRGGYMCVCLTAERTCDWYSGGRVECAPIEVAPTVAEPSP